MLVKFHALGTVITVNKKKSQLSWSLQSSGLMNLSLRKGWEESIADRTLYKYPVV